MTALVVAYLPNERNVILPALRHLLHSMAIAQSKLQVILAYNTPTSLPVEQELARLAATDRRLELLKVEGSVTKAENINAALPLIAGEITALFDADHRPEPRCFLKAMRWFSLGYDAVQGRCRIRNGGKNWLTRMIRLEFSTMYSVFHTARSLGADTALFGGSNGYWRTEALRILRLDSTMLTEDIDLTVRALLAGYRIVHDRSIISTELAPTTFTSWFYQRLRWAQGWYQVTRKHSDALVESGALNPWQKLYWTYMLPWREVFVAMSLQALPILLVLVAVQVRFGAGWHWDRYMTATTILTLLSGCVTLLVAHRHERLVGGQRHWPDAFAYMLVNPAIAVVRNITTLVAWLRESRREQQWITTSRDGKGLVHGDLLPPRNSKATPVPTAIDASNRLPPEMDGSSLRRSTAWVGVIALTLLGAALRLYGLDSQSLWLDEGISLWHAQRENIPQMLASVSKGDVHPPLYFAILHLWLRLSTTDSVFWIRLLSVIASCLTIPLAYGLARRLYGEMAGFLSALLLAVSPLSVHFAQEARPYALLGLSSMAAGYCLVRGLTSQ
ncbi:MAG: glycosyltransferase, partial [Actinomycetota bacterium]|nr:glycosyltransferase [Actinomycetota bacterium]